jgi:chemotaxis protein CheD
MLLPGQMHFGGEAASVRTLLGSCVAVTLWHPTRRIGGMCHFLLPARARRAEESLEGKYGDEALEAMVKCLRAARTEPGEYEAHLYGGADTMPEGSGVKFNVGERNIEQGWSLIDRYGFQLQGVDVGEDVPRTVTLTLASGQVDMRRGSGKPAPPPVLPAGVKPGAGPSRRS